MKKFAICLTTLTMAGFAAAAPAQEKQGDEAGVFPAEMYICNYGENQLPAAPISTNMQTPATRRPSNYSASWSIATWRAPTMKPCAGAAHLGID